MAGKNQEYGVDFRTLTIAMPPDEHKAAKMRSAEHGIPASTVCRMALADDALWKRAAKQSKPKGGDAK